MNILIERQWLEKRDSISVRVCILKEFPNYAICEDGKIFNLKKPIKIRKQSNSLNEYYQIKFKTVADKYPCVNLVDKDNKNRKMYVHRLLAMCFIKNKQQKPQVNHKNGNKSDYSLNNLEWVTAKQNVRHAFRHGLRGKGKVLSEEQVVEIKKRIKQGEPVRKIYRDFPVKIKIIYDIKFGRSWA